MSAAPLPKPSIVHWLSLDQLETPPARFAVSYWQTLRGKRLFPARQNLRMREIGTFLRHMSLVRVIDAGADFEHRIVGDAHVMAYNVDVQNRRFDEIERDAPALVSTVRPLFQKVVESRAPLALRTRTGYDVLNVLFTELESVLLPFGEGDEAVDHIAAFTTFTGPSSGYA